MTDQKNINRTNGVWGDGHTSEKTKGAKKPKKHMGGKNVDTSVLMCPLSSCSVESPVIYGP